MAHYIDKSALVAEIEKRIQESLDVGGATRGVYLNERMKEDSYILSFLDTFEVKEVDLDGEIKEVQRHYKTIEEYEGYPCTMYANNIEWIAKHFFELGMSVSNKVQKG